MLSVSAEARRRSTAPHIAATGLLVALVAASACRVDVDYAGTAFQCPDGTCPSGFECVESRCVPAEQVFADAGRGAADAAVTPADARRPADAQPADAQGLRGTYYQDLGFANEVLTRIDPVVDFTWERGAPDPSIDPDTFSIRWSGYVTPEYSETWTFHVVSDDGVLLWVDGTLVVDAFTEHVEREDSGTVVLDAGVDYAITLEYFDNLRNATARLLWSSPSQPKEVIPAVRLTPTPE